MIHLTTSQRQRLIFAAVLFSGFCVGIGLFLYSFNKNLLYFYSPTQLQQQIDPGGKTFNLGGLVEEGSVRTGEVTRFVVTDRAHRIEVVYHDLLPDLFAPGKGVVVTGVLRQDGIFDADTVLAKHDENYMPPEVAEMLEQ